MKRKVAIIAFIIAIVSVFIYNACCNEGFWRINADTLIAVITTFGVTYYLVQRRTDERYRKEFLFSLLNQVQCFVSDPKQFTFSYSSDHKEILLKIRQTRSKISTIQKYGGEFKFDKEAHDLAVYFSEYEQLYDQHQNDVRHLINSSKEIARWMQNIDSRCDAIREKLYPPML